MAAKIKVKIASRLVNLELEFSQTATVKDLKAEVQRRCEWSTAAAAGCATGVRWSSHAPHRAGPRAAAASSAVPKFVPDRQWFNVDGKGARPAQWPRTHCALLTPKRHAHSRSGTRVGVGGRSLAAEVKGKKVALTDTSAKLATYAEQNERAFLPAPRPPRKPPTDSTAGVPASPLRAYALQSA